MTWSTLRSWDWIAARRSVVGVHAPESEFGKRAENIDHGIRDHGLTYPIGLDNEFATWRAFRNDAWPTKYLFDPTESLVKRWVSEGSYSDIEAEIWRLFVDQASSSVASRSALMTVFRSSEASTRRVPAD